MYTAHRHGFLWRSIMLLLMVVVLITACRKKNSVEPQPSPPDAPSGLQVVSVTDSSVELQWQDHSTNELGFIIYLEHNSLPWMVADTVPANAVQFDVRRLQSSTPYLFRVAAYNAAGESSPTNEVNAQTADAPVVTPPTALTIRALGESVVQVSWAFHETAQHFDVQRRTTSAAWSSLVTVGATMRTYIDSTATAATDYFYRVASVLGSATAWSDSIAITTPQAGTPPAPDSLQATVALGTGITLTWVDRSANETRFEIGRGIAGQVIGVVATVPANVTTYTDSLRDSTGIYYYRVRAANALGFSAWTLPANADYRMCSSGIIPLCIANLWEYAVDSAGQHFSIRRQVSAATFIDGQDYYLINEFKLPSGVPHDLFYLRNQGGFGCSYLPAPLPPQPVPNLMFRYPAYDGDYYHAEGDCVLVVAGLPGVTLTVNGQNYSGVISYQRFFSPEHSVRYWVEPNTIGVIREDEYFSPPFRLEIQRLLQRYIILN